VSSFHEQEFNKLVYLTDPLHSLPGMDRVIAGHNFPDITLYIRAQMSTTPADNGGHSVIVVGRGVTADETLASFKAELRRLNDRISNLIKAAE
jgi:hypothetical protein